MIKKLLFTGLVIALFSCSKEETIEVNPEHNNSNSTTQLHTSKSNDCSETFTLYAGQNIDVGNVTITNTEDSIFVTYSTHSNWVLTETHLYVGSLAGLPTNNPGNPQIGQFPYNTSHQNITSYTIAIPIDPNLQCYIVAAHASVALIGNGGVIIQQETAWSEGGQINNGGSWATYSEYCLIDCCDIEEQSYIFYAGQTINVGNLNVVNDSTNLFVTFSFTGDWYTQQTHLYVGDLAGLPTNPSNTPIPGQFPYSVTHNPMTQTYTYTIPLASLSNCYIIAAHSEMVQVINGVITQTETGWSFGTEFPNTNRWGWYSEYCTQTCD